MIGGFLFALQFLTIIPVKLPGVDERKISNSLVFFPLVGLLIGLLLAGLNGILYRLAVNTFPTNIILVIFSVSITGGIHLDGLSDTADALLSGKNKDEMLAIMRDSHAGVMGVLSLICDLLLKIALLSSIVSPLKTISLLLMFTLGRWSLVFAMFLFPYARGDGKAKMFIQGMNLKIFLFSTAAALLCVVGIWNFNGLIILALTAAGTYLTGKIASNKIGGITGDTLGALNEVMEVSVLLAIFLVEKFIPG